VIASAYRRTRTFGGTVVLLALALATTLALLPNGPAADTGANLHPTAAPSSTTTGVTIGTVPAVAGFPVTLDGVSRLTDKAGDAHFNAAATSDQALTDRVALTDAVLPIDGQDVQVTATRLYRSGSQPLLALDLRYLVQFDFSSASGEPIDATGMTISVKSPLGQIVVLPADQPAWLQGSRVVNTGKGPVADRLEWTVQRVTKSGSNVVNTSQQKFRPAEQQAVDVKLLFFSMRLQVHDAFFDYAHGGDVELVYPDGHTRRLPLGDDERLDVSHLPRGHYTVRILGPGPAMSQPLAISRDQNLNLAFYSWWDVGTLVGALAALAAGLAVVGIRRRRRAAPDAPARHRRGKHRDDDSSPAAMSVETLRAEVLGSDARASLLAVLGGGRTE